MTFLQTLATIPSCEAKAITDEELVIFKDECITVCLFQNIDDLTVMDLQST